MLMTQHTPLGTLPILAKTYLEQKKSKSKKNKPQEPQEGLVHIAAWHQHHLRGMHIHEPHATLLTFSLGRRNRINVRISPPFTPSTTKTKRHTTRPRTALRRKKRTVLPRHATYTYHTYACMHTPITLFIQLQKKKKLQIIFLE